MKNKPAPRDRAARLADAKELGCGLITMLVFTLPLWAFSIATRGPRYALAALVVGLVVFAAFIIIRRMVRQR
jgi:hypothetical protein